MMVKPVLQPIGLLFEGLHISIYVVFPSGINQDDSCRANYQDYAGNVRTGIDSMQKLTKFRCHSIDKAGRHSELSPKIKNKAAQTAPTT